MFTYLCGPFLKSLLNLSQCCFCFMFQFFGQKACKILDPWPGIKLVPPRLEGEVLTTGPLGRFLLFHFKDEESVRLSGLLKGPQVMNGGAHIWTQLGLTLAPAFIASLPSLCWFICLRCSRVIYTCDSSQYFVFKELMSWYLVWEFS